MGNCVTIAGEMENIERLNSVRSHISAGRMDAAIKECLELVDLGSAEAPDYLGVLYYTGEGIPEDKKKALEYFLLSHNRGYAMGTYHLAGEYQRTAKLNEALDLHRSIAEVNPSAAYWAYREIEMLASDKNNTPSEADKYLRLASKMGHIHANRDLAMRTIKGRYGLHKLPYGLFLYAKTIVLGVKSMEKGDRFKYIDTLGARSKRRAEKRSAFRHL